MTYAGVLLSAMPLLAITWQVVAETRSGEHWKIAILDGAWESIRVGGVFMLAGPPVGALLYASYRLLVSGDASMFGLAVAVAFAYFLGAIPSLVTGMVLGGVHRYLGPRGGALVAGVTGFATAALWLKGGVRSGVSGGADIGWAMPALALVASAVLGYGYVRRRHGSPALPRPQQPAKEY